MLGNQPHKFYYYESRHLQSADGDLVLINPDRASQVRGFYLKNHRHSSKSSLPQDYDFGLIIKDIEKGTMPHGSATENIDLGPYTNGGNTQITLKTPADHLSFNAIIKNSDSMEEKCRKFMTEHFDPRRKKLALYYASLSASLSGLDYVSEQGTQKALDYYAQILTALRRSDVLVKTPRRAMLFAMPRRHSF